MDYDSELGKAKWVMGIGLVFLIALFMSWREIHYSISGKITEAQAVNVFDNSSNSLRRHRDIIAIDYQFTTADGRTQKGGIEVSPARALQIAETAQPLRVIYIPSDPSVNTLVVQRSWLWPIVLLVMTGAGVAAVVMLLREANAPIGGRKKAPAKARR